MSYVERVLQPGEQVRHISSIHWIVLWPGVAVAVLAVAAYWFSETRLLPRVWLYTAYALAVFAVVLLIKEWYQRWITKIAVTNRRVIYKRGLVRLQTNEMNMDKVENVQVNQSVLGRMFDFGTVKIHELDNERDPLIGTQDGTFDFTIPKRPIRRKITGLPAFTTVKGGAYFFLPGISALKHLAAL
jgi:hypothetical protein